MYFIAQISRVIFEWVQSRKVFHRDLRSLTNINMNICFVVTVFLKGLKLFALHFKWADKWSLLFLLLAINDKSCQKRGIHSHSHDVGGVNSWVSSGSLAVTEQQSPDSWGDGSIKKHFILLKRKEWSDLTFLKMNSPHFKPNNKN